jgi:hypothetical protein
MQKELFKLPNTTPIEFILFVILYGLFLYDDLAKNIVG